VLPLVRPLLVRSRQAGDRICVRGRRRSLKRLLMEAHVPAEQRGGWPVVSAGGEVVWVPGLELGPSAGEPGAPGLVRLELARQPGREARA
jgi:tRNA(Ile)-lysidine synthase